MRYMMESGYTDHFTSDDRRLLIALDERFKAMTEKVGALTLSITNSHAATREEYNGLEERSRNQYAALEERLRALENYRWYLAGGTIAASGLLGIVIHFWGK